MDVTCGEAAHYSWIHFHDIHASSKLYVIDISDTDVPYFETELFN